MDAKLVGWGRAVKQRMRHVRPALPPLWLFTDAARLGDARRAAARLPRGLCGVVLRDDAVAGRAALAAEVARLCRQRRNVLVVAGDARLARAVGAGVHLRGGRGAGARRGTIVTSSAHGVADLHRAWRRGAALAFLSPAFPTASHPGAPALGAVRWAGMARRGPRGLAVAVLGGVTGATVRRTGARWAGAIGALMP